MSFNSHHAYPAGINYSNIPSPFYGDGDQENPEGEANLTPYVAVRGVDLFDGDDSIEGLNEGRSSTENGIHRFLINVSPLNANFPNSGSETSLCNLDTIQLYSPNPKVNYKYGANYTGPTESSDAPYIYSKQGGVYDAPTPIRGAPVEFRRVYFRGGLVDDEKGHVTGSGCSGRSFQAIFACSNPVETTVYSGNTLYNSRDENFQHSDRAVERSWEEIEIFSCGSGDCEPTTYIALNPTNSGDFGYNISGEPYTGEDCEPCAELLVFSGCNVNKKYIQGTSGEFSGKCGTVIEIDQEKPTYARFNQHTTGMYGYEFTGDCDDFTGSCGSLLVISGCDLNYYNIVGTSGDISGLCGSLIKIPQHQHTYTTEVTNNVADYELNPSEPECATCEPPFIGFSGSGVTVYSALATGGPNSGRCGSIIQIEGGGETDFNFRSSGCLVHHHNTETNTVTYGINKSGVLDCLGYSENRVRMLIATGDYGQQPDGEWAYNGPPEGPVTSLTGDDGEAYFSLCDFTILRKCPEDEPMLSGCCVDPEGACCVSSSEGMGATCSLEKEEDCGGYFWGEGTNCTDSADNFSQAYPNDKNIGQLCAEGYGCYYDSSELPNGNYTCGGQTTLRQYYDTIYNDPNKEWDEDDSRYDGQNPYPSVWVPLGDGDCDDCPTTSTTTSTSSTTSAEGCNTGPCALYAVGDEVQADPTNAGFTTTYIIDSVDCQNGTVDMTDGGGNSEFGFDCSNLF